MPKRFFFISLLCFGLALVLNLEVQAQKNYFKHTETVKLTALNQPPEQPLSLWYNQPAVIWEDAMPLGNGRLGAMVYGGVAKERITLNEDTIWACLLYTSPSPRDRQKSRMPSSA